MSSQYDENPVRQSLKDLRAEYPDHQGLVDEKYYNHRIGLPADNWHRRRRSINRHFDDLDEQGQSPEDSPYYDPKPKSGPAKPQPTKVPDSLLLPGLFGNQPRRDTQDDNDDISENGQLFNRQHTIDDDDIGGGDIDQDSNANAGQSRPGGTDPFLNPPGLATNAEGDYQYNDGDEIEGMFAHVGGLGNGRNVASGDADGAGAGQHVPAAPGAKKFGFGGRVWNGLKALGGVVKNLSLYNLVRHGIFGANFRRGKVKKNMKKMRSLREQMDAISDGSNPEQYGALQSKWDVAEHKVATNQAKLGQHRQYYTGRKWAQEFVRVGAGRNMGVADHRKPFFSGRDVRIEPKRRVAPSAQVAEEPAEQLLPEQKVAAPRQEVQAQAPSQDRDWNVFDAQQQYGGDDLEYDENGQVVF